ncbi:3-keto-disaccharide hydrolase [Agaribacter marinus]|uniref:Large, multifunctional secreted protein n=1 Tax=Agaribacter marinus TaxID=1431249 RepID=A0AA37WJ93_9ALTE|nr:DUF1080 domain-containing protein [Agaribacter marinus]GLR71928.1 large, multifunctional secreted protein [Agaribacter marinus]
MKSSFLKGLRFAILGQMSLAVAFMSYANQQLPPQATEYYAPVPVKISTDPVPSDAIVLFDGNSTDAWEHHDGSAVKWTVEDGAMTVKPGSKGIRSKASFCDAQIHIEWRTPAEDATKKGQNDSNSGLFIMGRYEIQILNNYDNDTYVNGQAGSIYKQYPPLVNASKPRMEWQTYDIIFAAPRFDKNGMVTKKATMTALHNGVLVQNHSELQGSTTYKGLPQYKAHGCAPIHLQDHGSKVSFRNIWVREL